MSLTSLAFSPNIALSSFSSALSSVSPFGVILPTKMSRFRTSAPTLIMPSSSRFLRLSSPMLGISLVISSGPSLVSLDSISYFSIWTEVNLSSLINLLLKMMASSKLYPSHVINATNRFCPRASSPPFVDEPSASMVPLLTRSPLLTRGLWLTHVP